MHSVLNEMLANHRARSDPVLRALVLETKALRRHRAQLKVPDRMLRGELPGFKPPLAGTPISLSVKTRARSKMLQPTVEGDASESIAPANEISQALITQAGGVERSPKPNGGEIQIQGHHNEARSLVGAEFQLSSGPDKESAQSSLPETVLRSSLLDQGGLDPLATRFLYEGSYVIVKQGLDEQRLVFTYHALDGQRHRIIIAYYTA